MAQSARIRLHRYVVVAVVILAVAAGAAGAIAWRPSMPPIAPPDRASFAETEVARGAALAALGDCAACHTAENGRPYTGGRGIPTPFGIVYATNITPDPATGIGHWSLDAFRRAMRDGIDRAGRHLYPVLPYPHFTRATDDDIAAMYAFLMTRAPVQQKAPANALTFPFNWRPLLAGWNVLFLRPGMWRPDPSKDAEWNHGAYLVEAISHCGACHTPHNLLGAEQGGQALAGGEAEGWYAPPLQAGSPAPVSWNADALATYLRTGFDAGHGAAAGPMAPVTHQLATVPDADVHTIAVYVASLMPSGPTPQAGTPQTAATGLANPAARSVADPQALAIFNGACGACHGADAPMTRAGAPSLALGTAVNAPTSRGVVDMILHGLPWREGHAGPYMPAFSAVLTDAQVAVLATYLRARYSDRPPWQDVEATVQAARRQGGGT
ncbi:MAG TPA: c-type cytochrome [Acetobacteraceae bacterium]|jgi:mono/diheme cytochrome c family protein|nr:c-type cytochrome [Acetobacteraceae bacterium]